MVVSEYDMVVIGGGFAGTAASSLPPETLVLRANTFGRISGADVAESLPDRAATTG